MIMQPLAHAFKEWAVICRARRPGKRDNNSPQRRNCGGGRRHKNVEHPRFWLYPTFVHQQRDGIVREAQSLLTQAEAERPADHQVRLSHFAEVAAVFDIPDLGKGVESWRACIPVVAPHTVEARSPIAGPV